MIANVKFIWQAGFFDSGFCDLEICHRAIYHRVKGGFTDLKEALSFGNLLYTAGPSVAKIALRTNQLFNHSTNHRLLAVNTRMKLPPNIFSTSCREYLLASSALVTSGISLTSFNSRGADSMPSKSEPNPT